MKAVLHRLGPNSIERRIYLIFSVIILITAITFFSLRLFKLSRAGAEINYVVESLRVVVNFGSLVALSPIAIHGAKASHNRGSWMAVIIVVSILTYLISYALLSNLVNFFLGNTSNFEPLRNVRKLAINFGHIAILSFGGVFTVAYWAFRKKVQKDILLKDLQGNHNKINFSDIVMIKSDDHYQKIYSKHGFFYVRDTISQFQNKLRDEDFRRVHRSAIVNLSEIVRFTPNGNGEYHLEMSNGESVKVSRTYKHEIKNHLDKISGKIA